MFVGLLCRFFVVLFITNNKMLMSTCFLFCFLFLFCFFFSIRVPLSFLLACYLNFTFQSMIFVYLGQRNVVFPPSPTHHNHLNHHYIYAIVVRSILFLCSCSLVIVVVIVIVVIVFWWFCFLLD